MKIISPSFEILTPLDGQAVLKHIELCGRVCYKSEDKITGTSAATFVANIIKRGHEAVLEHFNTLTPPHTTPCGLSCRRTPPWRERSIFSSRCSSLS